jgi:hypothetical protein
MSAVLFVFEEISCVSFSNYFYFIQLRYPIRILFHKADENK